MSRFVQVYLNAKCKLVPANTGVPYCFVSSPVCKHIGLATFGTNSTQKAQCGTIMIGEGQVTHRSQHCPFFGTRLVTVLHSFLFKHVDQACANSLQLKFQHQKFSKYSTQTNIHIFLRISRTPNWNTPERKSLHIYPAEITAYSAQIFVRTVSIRGCTNHPSRIFVQWLCYPSLQRRCCWRTLPQRWFQGRLLKFQNVWCMLKVNFKTLQLRFW